MTSFKISKHKILVHTFFILVSLSFIIPMVLVLSISFSSESSITSGNAGYHLIPKEFSLAAYRMAFSNARTIVNAYIVTAAQAFLGTILTLVVTGMVAYPLSRSKFAYKGVVTFIIFFTMLFSGGLIPTYIIYTQWFHLGDSFWVYILPGLAGGAWNTLVMRTFFKALPESLFESVEIDGGSELTIFMKIAVPLSKPMIATIGFMTLVTKWNDWYTTLVFIRNDKLYTLQFLLQQILNQAQFIKNLMANPIPGINVGSFNMPAETLRYAICVIAAGPMLILFPFFQKYFAQGLTIGAIKG